MKKAIITLTDGFEEMEALVPADILRRAGARVILSSITGNLKVTGSHDIIVFADELFDKNIDTDMIILPGEDYLIFYSLIGADVITFFGMEERVLPSFSNRLAALFSWFQSQLKM